MPRARPSARSSLLSGTAASDEKRRHNVIVAIVYGLMVLGSRTSKLLPAGDGEPRKGSGARQQREGGGCRTETATRGG